MGSNEEKLEVENAEGFGLELVTLQPGLCSSSPRSGCLSEDQLSIKSDDLSCVRVKLMCSYGGRILPRPQDGQLRYIGGETRIVVVDRSISLAELSRRLSKLAGKLMLIKYQLPGEDLDALISVKTDEDLDNMMDEYEKMLARDSSSRLRLFLFLLMKQQQQQQQQQPGGAQPQSMEQHFVEALNSLPMSVEHEEIYHHRHQHYLEGQATKFRQQQQQHHHHQLFVDEGCTGYHHHQHNLMVGSPPSIPAYKLPPPPLPPPRAGFIETLDHHKGMLRSSSRSPTRHNNPGHEESPRSPGMPSSSRFREQGAVLPAMTGLYDHQQQQQPQPSQYRLPGAGYQYYRS